MENKKLELTEHNQAWGNPPNSEANCLDPMVTNQPEI